MLLLRQFFSTKQIIKCIFNATQVFTILNFLGISILHAAEILLQLAVPNSQKERYLTLIFESLTTNYFSNDRLNNIQIKMLAVQNMNQSGIPDKMWQPPS